MTDDDVTAAFAKVQSFVQGDHRAPHKPLLLLMALAALQRGEQWLAFPAIERTLARLIEEFGPGGRCARPAYPFWRLRNDGVWEVREARRLEPLQNRAGDVPVTALRHEDARGGIKPELYMRLRSRPALVNALASQILERAFPPSLHEQILDAVGFRWEPVLRRRRDPAFRDEVLRIYERRCAICGYDGRLGTVDLGLEAAHIKWHAAGGPDSPDNGLAVCSLHHIALDRGALTVDRDLRVQVSQHAIGGSRMEAFLLSLAGQSIRPPQRGAPTPAWSFLDWHREWVFREPARHA